MRPILFQLYHYTVYSYGTAMTVAFAICTLFAIKNRPKEILTVHHIIDFCLITLFSVLFINKLIKMLFSRDVTPDAFLRVIAFWEKGHNSVYWALLPTMLLLSLYARKKQLPVLRTLDFLFPYAMLALAIQRIFGCFLAGCCYGKPAGGWWGVRFPESSPAGRHFPNIAIHPTQLYYGVSALFISVVLLWYARHTQQEGGVTAFGFISFSSSYFLITFLRGDQPPDSFIFGLTISQYMSVFLWCAGCLLLFMQRHKTFSSYDT